MYDIALHLGLLVDEPVDGARLVVVARHRHRRGGDGAVGVAEVTRGAVLAALLVHLAMLPLHL